MLNLNEIPSHLQLPSGVTHSTDICCCAKIYEQMSFSLLREEMRHRLPAWTDEVQSPVRWQSLAVLDITMLASFTDWTGGTEL